MNCMYKGPLTVFLFLFLNHITVVEVVNLHQDGPLVMITFIKSAILFKPGNVNMIQDECKIQELNILGNSFSLDQVP